MPKGKGTNEYKLKVTLPSGLERRQSFYARTREEAEGKRDREYPPPIRQSSYQPGTFGWWWAEKWVPLKTHLEGSTLGNYEAASKHLLEEIGEDAVDLIDSTRLAVVVGNLARKRTPRNHVALVKDPTIPPKLVPLSASMVNRARGIALDVMALAAEAGAARPVNAKRVPRQKESAPVVDVYSPGEMRRLLEASRGSSAYTFALFGCFLGLTVNEGLALESDDLIGTTLRARTLVKEDGTISPKMKTDFRPRDFPLPPGLLEEIRALARAKGPLCRTSSKGTTVRLTDGNANRSLAAAARKAGLRPLTTQKLRHSFSSWLEDNDCPPTIRRKMMGQSTKKVEHRYNHPLEAKKREWLGKLWDEGAREYAEWVEAGGSFPKRGGGRPKAA